MLKSRLDAELHRFPRKKFAAWGGGGFLAKPALSAAEELGDSRAYKHRTVENHNIPERYAAYSKSFARHFVTGIVGFLIPAYGLRRRYRKVCIPTGRVLNGHSPSPTGKANGIRFQEDAIIRYILFISLP
jgi:hypothetical protein